ncbi:zf-HC2 domain-containing protein [Paenibacillus senegalimassiliensis]|uniref:zf-HC2 domain-containing protein n=1 Tax=Paenibacillus senegalimassiliensis TaxID=1737426 RepID=UPI00073E1551|nr:zf-HC2 domain-containing protein [Paenibacillus senegalimassiliensis]
MLKCHIVQDLLPNYIDGLVSKETEAEIQQHLQECKACQAIYTQMSTPTDAPSTIADRREIDFLRKIRRRFTEKLLLSVAGIVLVLAIVAYFIAIGSPVNQNHLVYKTEVKGDLWQLDLELTNNKALLVRTEPLYGEANANGIRPVIGTLLKPYQLVPSPLLEAENKSFMYGTQLDSFEREDYKIILRLDDGDVTFTGDNFNQ